jgi:hypothetical protein
VALFEELVLPAVRLLRTQRIKQGVVTPLSTVGLTASGPVAGAGRPIT